MAIRKAMYDFLFVIINNYMPTCSILGDIATKNIHDIEFDLSRSLKVKVDGDNIESPHMTSY